MASRDYFTLHEFLYSETALKNKIDNWPEDFWVIDNIRLKLLPALNKLRQAWGSGIKITSGYRSLALNNFIHGSKTSMHMKGLAADLVPSNGQLDLFIQYVPIYFQDKPFDQIILESSGSSKWVHLGIENNEGLQRRQVLNINL